MWYLIGRLKTSQPRWVCLDQILEVSLKETLEGLPLEQLAQAVELLT